MKPLLARAVRSLRAIPLALAVLAASAQQPAPSASALRTAVDAAWQRAQEAAEAQGQVLRAEASRAAASSLLPAAPAIELSHRDERWLERAPGAGRETELAAALPLWMPGQRAKRTAAAEAQTAMAQAAAAFSRWQIAGQVRELAWRVVGARAELRQAQAQRDMLERLAADVDRRVQAGDLARSDALAARAEALSAVASVRDAQLRLTELERQWVVLAGMPAPAAEQLDEPVPVSAAGTGSHPHLQLAERQVEHAQRQQAAVAADRRDPPELLLRYRQEAGGVDSQARNSVGVGVRIPLGGDVRNRPLEAAASSTLLVAQRQLEVVRAQVDATLKQAEDAHVAALERLAADRQRHALVSERAALVQRAFNAGDHSLPELLRALAASAAAQADLERSQAALGLARARLLQAQGITP